MSITYMYITINFNSINIILLPKILATISESPKIGFENRNLGRSVCFLIKTNVGLIYAEAKLSQSSKIIRFQDFEINDTTSRNKSSDR